MCLMGRSADESFACVLAPTFDHEQATEPTQERRNVSFRSDVLCGEAKNNWYRTGCGFEFLLFFDVQVSRVTTKKISHEHVFLLNVCFHQIRPDAVHNSYSTPLPHEYLSAAALPEAFDWSDVNGVSYLTKSLNQVCPMILRS